MHDYLTVEQVASRLGVDVVDATRRIRERGPTGTVRTAAGQFFVPQAVVDQLRDEPPAS